MKTYVFPCYSLYEFYTKEKLKENGIIEFYKSHENSFNLDLGSEEFIQEDSKFLNLLSSFPTTTIRAIQKSDCNFYSHYIFMYRGDIENLYKFLLNTLENELQKETELSEDFYVDFAIDLVESIEYVAELGYIKIDSTVQRKFEFVRIVLDNFDELTMELTTNSISHTFCKYREEYL